MTRAAFIEAQKSVMSHCGVAAEDRFVEVEVTSGQAHVLVAGEGPPLVMVNGLGTPAAMYAPLMACLEGVTMYAIDLPGFGLTDVATFPADYRRSAVLFLDQVLDALDLDQPPFVTNSLGSLWATWLAVDRPRRIRSLVHVGYPAIALGTSAPLPMRLLSIRGLGNLMMRIQPPSPRQVRQLSKMVNENPLTPEIAELLLATERLPEFEPTFLATLRTLLRFRGARPDLALTATQLADVNQPSTLILGADDPMGAPADGERFVAAVPPASLHLVEGGHAPWLHHSDQIAPLINEFIASTTAEDSSL